MVPPTEKPTVKTTSTSPPPVLTSSPAEEPASRPTDPPSPPRPSGTICPPTAQLEEASATSSPCPHGRQTLVSPNLTIPTAVAAHPTYRATPTPPPATVSASTV